MKHRFVLIGLGGLLGGCVGLKPMPDRLTKEEQSQKDSGWTHLVDVQSTVDRSALLDAVIAAQAWHAGVDELHMVSEKRVGAVRVVMESHFARANPAADMFTVRFVDSAGKVFRTESYSRRELDEVIDLMRTPDQLPENITPEVRSRYEQRLREKEARLKRVLEVFPQPPGQVGGPWPEGRQ